MNLKAVYVPPSSPFDNSGFGTQTFTNFTYILDTWDSFRRPCHHSDKLLCFGSSSRFLLPRLKGTAEPPRANKKLSLVKTKAGEIIKKFGLHFLTAVTLSFYIGFLLLHESRAQQQAALRILFAHHSLGSLSGQGNGGYCEEDGMELHLDHLRGEQLWAEGVRRVGRSSGQALDLYCGQRETVQGFGSGGRSDLRPNCTETVDQTQSKR